MTMVLAGALVDGQTVRQMERDSIRGFVSACVEHLDGDVLDLGCGNGPYRELVRGEYHGFDRESFPANVSGSDIGLDIAPLATYGRWDAILCTQVIQYIPRPHPWLVAIRFALKPGGHLVLTGPTNWAEVEPQDLHRYTLTGIIEVVANAGLAVVQAERRAFIDAGGFQLSLGYGVLAQR